MIAAALVAGSGQAAAHRLGLSHSTVKHHLAHARSKVGATTAQLVWILASRLPEPKGQAGTDEKPAACRGRGTTRTARSSRTVTWRLPICVNRAVGVSGVAR